MLIIRELEGNGDFRSAECLKFLEEADVVITNPPFSLFREYVAQLMEYNKKFIVIGNFGAINDKDIFPYIKNNELWLGVSKRSMEFITPNKEKSYVNACWFTNVNNKRRNEEIDLYKKYVEKNYPKYENFNAIEVSKVCEIPMDYEGIMGVPITFLEKYNPNQFEIVWQAAGNTRVCCPKEILEEMGYAAHKADRGGCGVLNGKPLFTRILIRRK